MESRDLGLLLSGVGFVVVSLVAWLFDVFESCNLVVTGGSVCRHPTPKIVNEATTKPIPDRTPRVSRCLNGQLGRKHNRRMVHPVRPARPVIEGPGQAGAEW